MRLKKLGLAGLLFLLCMGTAACGKPEETKVTIGYFNNITHAQALLMKHDNLLQDALGDEIAVNWIAFNAGPAEVEALFSQEVDIGYIGPVPAISANVKSGGDVQILSGATKAGAILVKRADADINAVSDLSGKVVAIPQIGNTQHLTLLNLLSENNLKPITEGGDVTITAVANADVANAMDRGDIDAALVPEPWGATLLEGGAQMVLDDKQVYQNGEYDVAVVVVRREFYEEHPEIVAEFLAQHEAATVVLNEDRDNALQTVNEELEQATGKKLSDSIIRDAFSRIGVNIELDKESIERFANISKEQEFIDALPDSSLYLEQ